MSSTSQQKSCAVFMFMDSTVSVRWDWEMPSQGMACAGGVREPTLVPYDVAMTLVIPTGTSRWREREV